MIALILIVIAVLCVMKARRVDRSDVRAIRSGCAACRGERGGEAILQPADAPLCQPHYQKRHQIELMEKRLLR